MNELSVMTDSNIMLFDDSRFMQLEKIALAMSLGTVSIPKHLQGKPGDCLAVAMQACQWGMNPFAVAQKTYFINHTISYEAQLVNAVISSSRAIKGAFKYKYDGEWNKIAGKKPQTKAGWGNLEEGLTVSVGAILAGDDDITWGEPVYLSSVIVRNSPLWGTHVKQQIAYLAVNMWARMYTPSVILGVYTPEEVQAHDITPPTVHEDEQKEKLEAHKAKVNASKTEKKKPVIEGTTEEFVETISNEEEPAEEVVKPLTLKEFKTLLAETETPEQMKDRQSEYQIMKGATKKSAIVAFKERLNELRAPKQEAEEETPKEKRPVDGAYDLLGRAKTEKDLDTVVDFVMELNKGGKITQEEIDDFDVEHSKKHSEIVGEG